MGKLLQSIHFRTEDQVVTLNTKLSVKIDGDEVQVNPQLLFQRLITAAKTSDDLESAFKYELRTHPPALFDSSLLNRRSQPWLMPSGVF